MKTIPINSANKEYYYDLLMKKIKELDRVRSLANDRIFYLANGGHIHIHFGFDDKFENGYWLDIFIDKDISNTEYLIQKCNDVDNAIKELTTYITSKPAEKKSKIRNFV